MAKNLKPGRLSKLPKNQRRNYDFSRECRHKGVRLFRGILIPIQGAEEGGIRETAHLLFSRQFRCAHFRHFSCAEFSSFPNFSALSGEIDGRDKSGGRLPERNEAGVGLASFENFHSLAIIEPGRNLAKAVS